MTVICGNPKYGPCFQGQLKIRRVTLKDISLHSNSNINNKSYCCLGFSYQHQDYVKQTDIAKNILAATYYFETVEIFTKVD